MNQSSGAREGCPPFVSNERRLRHPAVRSRSSIKRRTVSSSLSRRAFRCSGLWEPTIASRDMSGLLFKCSTIRDRRTGPTMDRSSRRVCGGKQHAGQTVVVRAELAPRLVARARPRVHRFVHLEHGLHARAVGLHDRRARHARRVAAAAAPSDPLQLAHRVVHRLLQQVSVVALSARSRRVDLVRAHAAALAAAAESAWYLSIAACVALMRLMRSLTSAQRHGACACAITGSAIAARSSVRRTIVSLFINRSYAGASRP